MDRTVMQIQKAQRAATPEPVVGTLGFGEGVLIPAVEGAALDVAFLVLGEDEGKPSAKQ